MKKEEILKKAIEKAVENGWGNNIFNILFADEQRNIFCEAQLKNDRYFTVIFDHSFAKAFWGDGCLNYDITQPRCSNTKEVVNKNIGKCPLRKKMNPNCYKCNWKKHIQLLALLENRLEYISKFLEVKNENSRH